MFHRQTIDIEPTEYGFNYTFSRPIAIAGFEPTLKGLAEIIQKTILAYMPPEQPQAPKGPRVKV